MVGPVQSTSELYVASDDFFMLSLSSTSARVMTQLAPRYPVVNVQSGLNKHVLSVIGVVIGMQFLIAILPSLGTRHELHTHPMAN